MISISNLSCNYDDVKVVKNINLTINNGESLSIIGPNGCGKTTLLKAIANIIPYEGEIKLNNKDLRLLTRKETAKTVALMNQISEIYFPYTVYETVSLGRYPYKKGIFSSISFNEKEFIEECIENVGLIDLKDRMISSLSGGQLQRVFLARAFAQDPSVLLLDEPTNHLDLNSQIQLLEYINKWKEKNNRAVVAVIHDLNLVQNFCENVALMDKGEVIINSSANNVFNSDDLKTVYKIDVKKFMINTLEKWKS
ncbi:MAG: ABC transporter ATP-binding protein [Clostridium sp.]|uniref:ABC transporter ATP-binding protein n=1 Tax=Clostridium sp. TaxID=1506 RepID=UPI002FC63F9B